MKINRTVQRAVEIMSYVAAHPDGVSIDELCEQLSLPKTSAYDILVTLVETKMLTVRQGGPRQLYQTGIGAYQIGMSYASADDELKLVGEALKELAYESGRTAFFGTLSGTEVLYLLKEVPENPIITTATVGSTAPLYCTSLGKALLAHLPSGQAETLIRTIRIVPRTEYTVKSISELQKELKLSRERGYALDFREYEEHMLCVSAPVYRRDGTLAGAVSISGFYRPEADYESAGRLIREKAARISSLLGYHSA